MDPKAAASATERRCEPLQSVHPLTGASIEVFYGDRVFVSMEGEGWFWWTRDPGGIAEWPPHGPFASGSLAYLDAMGSNG